MCLIYPQNCEEKQVNTMSHPDESQVVFPVETATGPKAILVDSSDEDRNKLRT